MTSSRHIAVIEESQVGFARRSLVEICQRISRDETFCGKAAIVVTEMARNVVRHGKGGEIVIREIVTPASLVWSCSPWIEARGYAISRSAFETASQPPVLRVLALARSNVFRTGSRCSVSRGREPWFGYGCALLTIAAGRMLSKAAGSALPLSVRKSAVMRGKLSKGREFCARWS